MSEPLVLTFDVGTQSLRSMLVDKAGNIVDKEQIKYEKPYVSAHPGWAEQRADFYWENLCAASLRLKDKVGARWADIIAVTITTIRDTCVCVDKDGKPLRDIIVWLDKREADTSKPLPALNRLLFGLVGMSDTVEMQRRVTNCNWIIQNQPEIWAKTYRYLMLSGYLTYRLTGNFADSNASAIGHIPMDYKARAWAKKSNLTRCIFEMEDDKLFDLVDPEDVLGGITPEASALTGIPAGMELIATGSDKGCETLGLSVTTPEKASISFGTSATVQVASQKYIEPMPFVPAYPSPLRGHYNPEIQVYRGYWLVSWFKKEFAAKEVEQARALGVSPEDLLNDRMKEIPPGCEGLLLQPYFTPGIEMPRARGAIIGFSDVHTRIHIYRAIVEGINFALMDGMYSLEKRGHLKVQKLYVGGGGSQSDLICQITADMFGLPVYRIQTHEACGLGSSMVAFVAKGVFKDYQEATESMVHIKDEYLPDEANHALYARLYHEIFTKIFGRLLPLYRRSMAITGRSAENEEIE